MTAQSLAQRAPHPSAQRVAASAMAHVDHPFVRLFAFVLVLGSFYLIEHSWTAQASFSEMIGASSPEQLATNEMFQTSSYRQLGAFALGIFGGLVLLFSARKGNATLGALGGLLLFYVAWNGLSLLWADDPGVSMRRYSMLIMLCLGAYGIQAQLSLRQIGLFSLCCTGLFLLIGIAAEVWNKTFTPMTAGYRFAGTLHPNAQAVNCALLLLAAVALATSEKQGTLRFWAVAILAAGFLYLTKSRTALVAVAAVLALHWTFRQTTTLRIIALTGIIGGGLALLVAGPMIADKLSDVIKLGRTDLGESTGSFTGRVPVWKQAWEYVEERPFLGYGYGGFWNEEHTTAFIERQQWPVPHAHNAYLDVMLEAGPLAVLVYFLILAIGIRKGYALWRTTGNSGYVFLSLLLLFCLLNGFLESITIQRSLITFICMIVLITLAFREPEAAVEA